MGSQEYNRFNAYEMPHINLQKILHSDGLCGLQGLTGDRDGPLGVFSRYCSKYCESIYLVNTNDKNSIITYDYLSGFNIG
jgi:hypothetical protein